MPANVLRWTLVVVVLFGAKGLVMAWQDRFLQKPAKEDVLVRAPCAPCGPLVGFRVEVDGIVGCELVKLLQKGLVVNMITTLSFFVPFCVFIACARGTHP
jgi:hypothetical protein